MWMARQKEGQVYWNPFHSFNELKYIPAPCMGIRKESRRRWTCVQFCVITQKARFPWRCCGCNQSAARRPERISMVLTIYQSFSMREGVWS